MALHAIRHKHESVHGALLGKIVVNDSVQTVQVHSAVAIAHGTPTKPLVEMAMGILSHLLDSTTDVTVVGWYTAPLLANDTRPGPVALRMMSTIASTTTPSHEPVLLVLQNNSLGSFVKGGDSAASSIAKAFGKDFGQQWLQPIEGVTLQDSVVASRATREALQQDLILHDFVDHVDEEEEEESKVEWYPNPEIVKVIQNCS